MRGVGIAAAAPGAPTRPIPATRHHGEAFAVGRPAPAKCPCCGGELGPSQVVVDLRSGTVATSSGVALLMPRTTAIVDALNQARGKSLTVEQIIWHVYGDDRDGGPLTAEGQIKKQVHFARFGHDGYASIRAIGLDIKTSPHGYYLTTFGGEQ